MAIPKAARRKFRWNEITQIHEQQMSVGLLEKKMTKVDDDREIAVFTNRPFIEACKWRIEKGKITKKKLVKELFDRLAGVTGKKEKLRIEKTIHYFEK